MACQNFSVKDTSFHACASEGRALKHSKTGLRLLLASKLRELQPSKVFKILTKNPEISRDSAVANVLTSPDLEKNVSKNILGILLWLKKVV